MIPANESRPGRLPYVEVSADPAGDDAVDLGVAAQVDLGVGTKAADENPCDTGKFSGPADLRWRAAEMLAGAWGPALERSYHLGYATGYDAGRWSVEHEMAEAWAQMASKITATLAQPTHDELQARRGEHP